MSSVTLFLSFAFSFSSLSEQKKKNSERENACGSREEK